MACFGNASFGGDIKVKNLIKQNSYEAKIIDSNDAGMAR